MLERVLEPEVMDSPGEAAEYDAMDHAEVNRRFAADFLAVWDGRGPILDVGTGTAQIPVELCRRSPAGEIVGVDLADSMLELGRRNVESAGLARRVRLEKANARELPYPGGSFPAVMSNSIVHHIPEPAACLAEVTRVAGAGATIFVRDLQRPANEEELARLVEAYAGGASGRQRGLFADSLRAALTVDEVRAVVTGLGFDPAGVAATSDRHWTWAVPGRGR